MEQYFSSEGLQKLKEELEERRNKLRPEINIKILEAKDLGDLSENAEYAEAKDMQSFNEGRIVELDDLIKDAVIIDPSKKPEAVVVGATIKVNSKGVEKKLTIVGAAECNPAEGFISNESPLALALIGKRKGDEVEVRTPVGVTKYKILEIG